MGVTMGVADKPGNKTNLILRSVPYGKDAVLG
jgi:hypothetical protein